MSHELKLEKALKSRSKLFGSYAAPVEHICDHGEGNYLYDHTGRKYLDFASVPMTCSIGHGNRKVAQAAAEQMEKLHLCWPYFWVNEREGELAERILEKVPRNLTSIQFVNSGSEATDSAIKVTYQYFLEKGKPEKRVIISRWQSFHGSTLGAGAVTGFSSRRVRHVMDLPLAPMIDAPLCYRCPYNMKYPGCEVHCAKALERLIHQIGPQYVAAFFFEPVGGSATAGMVPVPEYYPMIREICDRHDVLMIDDECCCVFGRTGKWFGIDHWDVKPDIVTMAKGMSAGYTSIGAMVVDGRIAEAFEKAAAPFFNAYSTAGNPVSCAVVHAVLDIIEEGGLVERNAILGEYLHRKAREKLAHHECVGDIRGKGLMMGIELVRNKEAKETFPPELKAGSQVKRYAMERGVLVYPTSGMDRGVRGDAIIICPPFFITEAEIDAALDVVDQALDEFEKGLRG